jgi:hypothetical protein
MQGDRSRGWGSIRRGRVGVLPHAEFPTRGYSLLDGANIAKSGILGTKIGL